MNKESAKHWESCGDYYASIAPTHMSLVRDKGVWFTEGGANACYKQAAVYYKEQFIKDCIDRFPYEVLNNSIEHYNRLTDYDLTVKDAKGFWLDCNPVKGWKVWGNKCSLKSIEEQRKNTDTDDKGGK